MNRTEHLLCCLAEECSEVAQRVSKALRFGLDEIQPGQDLSNEERIWQEINDMVGVTEMLMAVTGNGGMSRIAVDAKKVKIQQFLEYSRQCGTLTPDKS